MRRRSDEVLGKREGWYKAPIFASATVLAVVLLSTYEPSACGGSLQSMVDAASPGDTIEARSGCVYREEVSIDKPITLKGQQGAEIRGSDIWTVWEEEDGLWRSEEALPGFFAHGTCQASTSLGLMPEQVFLDGEPLEQVPRDQRPESGQFSVNGERRVVLADDPSNRTAEVTTRRHWVRGASEGVSVEGFAMRHAANDSQGDGAVSNGGHPNWVVKNNDLSNAHGAVVSLSDAEGLELAGNEISSGGQLGVHASGAGGLVVRNNKIHHNNTEGFAYGWEAGGAKTSGVEGLVFDANEVYDNKGKGVWCDVYCQNTVFSNNRISHNGEAGIHYEISSGAKIHGNVIWENGWDYQTFGWGGGIVSSSSKNLEIYDNTLAWNADGIAVISADRDGTDYDAVTDVAVHNNTVLGAQKPGVWHQFALLWGQDFAGGVMFDPLSKNRGYDNRYWFTASEPGEGSRFQWGIKPMGLLALINATPGEERGRYLSNTEKDQVVSAKRLPATPKPR